MHDREDDLRAASDKLGRILFETSIRLTVYGPAQAAPQALRRLREMAGAFRPFSVPRLASFQATRVRRSRRGRHAHGHTFLLSAEELATLWRPPTATGQTATLAAVESRELPAPPALPTPGQHPDLAVLGTTVFRGERRRFSLLSEDRRRHLTVVGETGVGKSTLLLHLLAADIAAGRGVGLLDPHGDLCEAVLRAIPVGGRTT